MKDPDSWALHAMAKATNPKIQAINARIVAESEMLSRLRRLKRHQVERAPEWESCYHVEFKNASERKIAMGMLASCLVHQGKLPLELACTPNCVWVRTG